MIFRSNGLGVKVVKSIYFCIRSLRFDSPSPNIACINKLFRSLALLQLFVSAQSQSYKEKLKGSSFLVGDQRKNVDRILKIYNYKWLSNT